MRRGQHPWGKAEKGVFNEAYRLVQGLGVSIRGAVELPGDEAKDRDRYASA